MECGGWQATIDGLSRRHKPSYEIKIVGTGPVVGTGELPEGFSPYRMYSTLHGQENPSSSLQATVLFSAICMGSGFIIQISAHAGKRELHYVTSCHMTLFYHFTKPSAENTQLWWKSVLSNKLSRINIAKLISFLTENENLIKQPSENQFIRLRPRFLSFTKTSDLRTKTL
ncbi:hypothetical protein AVEN_155042-1 [Araneus ventricosus]|uniref:Uncharacterized protein n=1 Tax=Araneus ventricosus TaxID=182803 RepID=A0A4Y2A8U2_ARAVE|nr:hypothetical protein AVEN_155042-1 [Araneus ventricosus]